jgi:hypothetical protein
MTFNNNKSAERYGAFTPIDHFRQEVAYIGSIVGCTLQAGRVTLVPIHTGLRVIYVLIRPTTSTVVSFERVVRIFFSGLEKINYVF